MLTSGAPVIFTANYTRQTGTVQIQANPENAPWSFLDGDGKAHTGKGNATLAGIPTGQIAMTWQALTGYTKPAGSTKTLATGGTVAFAASYTRQTGSLKVTLLPAGAVSAGAQWRRVGTSTWRASGSTESGVPTGSVTIEFKTITRWITPAKVSVTVNNNQLTQTARIYGNKNNAADGRTWNLYDQ
jgi:hypothetical protein